MKTFKYALIFSIMTYCFASTATPIFTMTPVNVPSIVIAGKTTILSYQVTPNNNTLLNQPNGVVLNAITPAVASFLTSTEPGDCQSTELFAGRTTCTLKLLIDATNLQAGQVISGKPIYCNHPELTQPMYCSQPAEAASIKVVSPDDPGISAVTVTPNSTINLYPGETQTLTVKNTSGDNVTTITASTDIPDNVTITNHCSGELKQGATCTIDLNTTTTPEIGTREILTIQANTYTPIQIPVVISPVTVVAGAYMTKSLFVPQSSVVFEGLIWVKKTNWTKTLPAQLENYPVLLFSVSSEYNDWLVVGAERSSATPISPLPPYTFHDKPVILESTDNAQNFNVVTPNLGLPDNTTLLTSDINRAATIVAGFDGTFDYDPLDPSKKPEADFTPIVITRDATGVWNNEIVNLPDGLKRGAITSLSRHGDDRYAGGLAAIFPVFWQRVPDAKNGGFVWNELPYYDDVSDAPFGIFFSIHNSDHTLIGVGTKLNISSTGSVTDVPLMVTGNYDPTQQQWTWQQPTLPLPTNALPTHLAALPAAIALNEISSVRSNKNAAPDTAHWIAVGYSVIIDTATKKHISDSTPLVYINKSANATDSDWILLDMHKFIPNYEAWELDSVNWNGQQWMAVGTRYSKNAVPPYNAQPLIIVSDDGLTWSEVVNGLPKHALNELIPLILATH